MPNEPFKRGKSWYVRVQVDGRDIRRSLGQGTRAEARSRAARLVETLRNAQRVQTEPLRTAVIRWQSEILVDLRTATADRYIVSVKAILDHWGNDAPCTDINKASIAAFVSSRRRAGATAATVKRDLTALSSLLRSAEAWGWVESNPARLYDRRATLREVREPIRPVSDDELAALLAVLPPVWRALVLLARHTGCRQAELTGLAWADVRDGCGVVELMRTKTRRPRVLHLSAEAQAVLRGLPRRLGTPWVFWHGDGEPMRSVATGFPKWFAKVPRLRRFRFHDLRHTYAIRRLQAEGDIYALSKWLGHTSVKTTEMYLGWIGQTPAQNPAQGERSGTAPRGENPRRRKA